MFFSTSVLAQDPYRYCAPTGGASNCPTTVESSVTSLAWIKNPRNVGATAVDSRTTVRDARVLYCMTVAIQCIANYDSTENAKCALLAHN